MHQEVGRKRVHTHFNLHNYYQLCLTAFVELEYSDCSGGFVSLSKTIWTSSGLSVSLNTSDADVLVLVSAACVNR